MSGGADSRDGELMAVYPTDVRVVFVFKRSAMIRAPSTFKSLEPKLQKWPNGAVRGC